MQRFTLILPDGDRLELGHIRDFPWPNSTIILADSAQAESLRIYSIQRSSREQDLFEVLLIPSNHYEARQRNELQHIH